MRVSELFYMAHKNNIDVRIVCESRWMIQDDDGIFTVYERKPYQKKTKILCETNYSFIAVSKLFGINSTSKTSINESEE